MKLETNRLILKELSVTYAGFIFDLVNTEEWIRYIGNRNVANLNDAVQYIQKIIDNKTSDYWVVELKNDHTPIGVITYFKRDYLDNKDIGFAFLPAYTKKGFALEATECVLKEILKKYPGRIIHAISLPENMNSIKLLGKLGFRFDRELSTAEDRVLIYSLY
jgi:[ribosomal protein S5]-alanine N-acetyltransferase